MAMLLFLDFDGVLHPDAVYLHKGKIELRSEGELFMWAPHLLRVIDGANVRIVLSTSWVRHVGFQRARKALPEAVGNLVIGATWHSGMRDAPAGQPCSWDLMSRYEQIQGYLGRLSKPVDWVAVDDDGRCWPQEKAGHLIQTDPWKGLSSRAVREKLRQCLLRPVQSM